jgi:hypothetical protein
VGYLLGNYAGLVFEVVWYDGEFDNSFPFVYVVVSVGVF